MKRREFITLLGGAVAWPLAARAQQSANTNLKNTDIIGGVKASIAVNPNNRNPQNANATRERIIRECDLAERAERPDPREGKKTGSRMFAYRACMAKHGQIE